MTMKNILAIDSSTLTASVAIVRGDENKYEILATGQSDVNTHSQQLIPLIDSALATAGLGLEDLQGIAIGAGPGSFTGLRIGMATAKGLAFAAQKPLWAVSSLAALALAVDGLDLGDVHVEDALIVPVMDARRSEIFVGFYRVRQGTAEAVADERVMAPDALGPALARMLEAGGFEAAGAQASGREPGGREPGGPVRAIAVGDGLGVYGPEIEQAVAAQGLSDQILIARDAAATPPATAVARLTLHGEHPDILTSGAPTYIRLSEAEIKYPNGNPGGTFSQPS